MRIGIISAGALFAMTLGVIAQSSPIQETKQVLDAAKANGQSASDQISKEQSRDGGALDRLAQEAQRALGQPADTAGQQRMAADGRKLEDTLKTLSPEAQKLLNQGAGPPALRAPDPDNAVKALPVAPAADAKGKKAAAAADPAAGAGEPPVKKDNDIHITGQGAAYFDSAQAIGVFTDDVEVVHPQFHLYCEQLEVYMLKDAEKKEQDDKKAAAAAKAASPTPAPATGAAAVSGAITTSTTAARSGDPDATPAPGTAASGAPAAGAPVAEKGAQPDNSIRQAIARGPKVVIIKNTENGENQVGVCRNATYVGENGDIILRDMPVVERGNHVHYATDPSTYMIIKQDGKLHTFGPSKVDIIEEKEKKPAAPGAPAATPATPAPPGPARPAKTPGTPKKGKL